MRNILFVVSVIYTKPTSKKNKRNKQEENTMKEKILKFFIATLAAVAVLAGGVSYSKGLDCAQLGIQGWSRGWVQNNGVDPTTGETIPLGSIPTRYNGALNAVGKACTALNLDSYAVRGKASAGKALGLNEYTWPAFFGLTNDVIENAFVQAGGQYRVYPVSNEVRQRMIDILTPIAIQNAQMHLNGGKAVASAQPAVAQTAGLTKAQKDQIKAQIKTQQEYITSLQSQYQNAMNAGNVAYAQQCQQLIALWQASNNQLQAQLK